MEISTFKGPHAFLSNFFPSVIVAPEMSYPTVEHYFQAMKTTDHDERREIAHASTAAQAKLFGRRAALRPDWEQIKIPVMRAALRTKFAADSEFATLLLSTGDALLVEGNTWNDQFWGVSNGQGHNWLGHLLMARRAELRAAYVIEERP